MGVKRSMTAGGRIRAVTQHAFDGTHKGVTPKMVAQVLDRWVLRAVNTNSEGVKSRVYFGFAQDDFMLRVVVSMDDHWVVVAFPDRNATRHWAKGDLAYFNKYTDVEEWGNTE